MKKYRNEENEDIPNLTPRMFYTWVYITIHPGEPVPDPSGLRRLSMPAGEVSAFPGCISDPFKVQGL